MSLTQSLDVFIRVAESLSLSGAARSLDLTPAAVSSSIKRLEAELGTLLFVRTTRQLRLTLAGERFLPYAREGVHAIDQGLSVLRRSDCELQGPLRMSIPSDLGRSLVIEWLDEFVRQHPAVELQLDVSDRLADVYRQPVDVLLRYGQPSDSGMVAFPVAPTNRRVLCASPTYVVRRGTPQTPSDLVRHSCLSFMLGQRVHDEWTFVGSSGLLRVTVPRSRISSDGEIVHRWALDGHGIAYKSMLDVSRSLQEGRLVTLCTAWQGETAPLYLLSPQRREVSPVITAVRSFLSMRCKLVLADMAKLQ